MHSSSDTSQVAAGRFLRVVFILVLSFAAFAGVLVSDSAHLGLAMLGVALIAGPVAVFAEDRTRAPAA
ncbi:MAG TPA: hypothetical protein VMH40_12715 [Myxococcaceae bacterium]|nr:hypothetical protein [Myxococcaceae bacterium]